jgi:hypothetical protein
MEPAWAKWEWSGVALSSCGMFLSSFSTSDFTLSLLLLILGRLLAHYAAFYGVRSHSLAHSVFFFSFAGIVEYIDAFLQLSTLRSVS